MIKYFSRCRTLVKILSVIDIIIGIIFAFNVFELLDSFKHEYVQFLFFFTIGFILFLFILITIIVLKCIIKDAEEDLTAIENIQKNIVKNNE